MLSFLIYTAHAAIVNCDPLAGKLLADGNPNPLYCGRETLGILFLNLMRWGIEFAILIAILALTYGGLLIMFGGASQERYEKGQKAIQNAGWGLALTLGAWIIMNTIITFFTTCTAWNIFSGIKC